MTGETNACKVCLQPDAGLFLDSGERSQRIGSINPFKLLGATESRSLVRSEEDILRGSAWYASERRVLGFTQSDRCI